MVTNNELFDALGSLQEQGKRLLVPEVAVLKAIRRVNESFAFTEHAVEKEERSLPANLYLCVYPDQITNGDFETDLTGWTEVIDAGITAVTQSEAAQGQTFAQQGSMGSLEMQLNASTGAGAAYRHQVLTAAPAEVWNFEVYMRGSSFVSGAFSRLEITWRDSGSSAISSANADSTDVTGDFVQLKLENQTAPALTVDVQIKLMIHAAGSGDTGLCWFDLARAEKGATTISDRARRIIAGEFVCRETGVSFSSGFSSGFEV